MDRAGCPGSTAPICFPRERGDGPMTVVHLQGSDAVFPASAGMDRASAVTAVTKSNRFPRERGDGPFGLPLSAVAM